MLCNYFQNSHRKKGSFPFSFGECLRHWLQRVVNKETLKQALIGIKRQFMCARHAREHRSVAVMKKDLLRNGMKLRMLHRVFTF